MMTQDEVSGTSQIDDSQPGFRPASTVVVGLGNPILGDDGVGWRVAESVQQILERSANLAHVVVECYSLGGLSLMEHLIGYDQAILIDSINLQQGEPGTIYSLSLDEFPENAGGHLRSSHDTDLQTALKVGRSMGAHLPNRITVVGIESVSVYDFSEALTPAVEAALPSAVQAVIDILNKRK